MPKAEKYHLLHSLAKKYETHDFLKDDPSYFMHQVTGKEIKRQWLLLQPV